MASKAGVPPSRAFPAIMVPVRSMFEKVQVGDKKMPQCAIAPQGKLAAEPPGGERRSDGRRPGLWIGLGVVLEGSKGVGAERVFL